jgi:hypothetical protein
LKAMKASTWPRRKLSMRASRKKRRKIMRAVAEHHHEGHQRAPGTADCQMAEVAPVHLRLLARQRAQAQVGLGWRPRAQLGDEVAEVRVAAHVAALADHGVQPRGGERGELGQRREDEGPVRVDAAGPQG